MPDQTATLDLTGADTVALAVDLAAGAATATATAPGRTAAVTLDRWDSLESTMHLAILCNINARRAAAPAGPTTIDPATLTGRALDLLADPTRCFTDAGSTQATVGASVQQWNDQSGNARHFAQTDPSLRPVLRQVGGLYYLQWDGVDDLMAPLGADLSVTDHTIYTAWRMDDARTGWGGRCVVGDRTGSTSVLAVRNATFGTTYQGGGSSRNFTSDGAAAGVLVGQGVRRSGSAVTLWTSGTQVAGSLTLASPSTPFVIGQVSGYFADVFATWPFKGYLRRVVVFAAAHDDATVAAVTAWLAAN